MLLAFSSLVFAQTVTRTVYSSRAKVGAASGNSSVTGPTAGQTNATSTKNVMGALGKLGASIDRNREDRNAPFQGIFFQEIKKKGRFNDWNENLEYKNSDGSRDLKKGELVFEHNKADQTDWTFNNLDGQKPKNYIYNADVVVDKSKTDETGSVMMVIKYFDEERNRMNYIRFSINPVKKMAMVTGNTPTSGKYCWWGENSLPNDGGWFKTDLIKDFDNDGLSKNELKIKILENKIIFMINNSTFYSTPLEDEYAFYLGGISGVGIGENGLIKGRWTFLQFKKLVAKAWRCVPHRYPSLSA